MISALGLGREPLILIGDTAVFVAVIAAADSFKDY
jgi:hypothetical protein